jgi:hypothetical protein
VKADLSAVCALGILAVSIVCSILLLELRPPTGLAAPSAVFRAELGLVILLSLLLVSVAQPVRDTVAIRASSLVGFLGRRVSLSVPARLACSLVLLVGLFVFSFWAVADLLGGYNGYGYSFSTHPFLPVIYSDTGLWLFRSWDAGDQSTLFLAVATAGFFALRVNGGIGAALKDSITLFAAPAVAAFELALWYFAPADMSWHVTDFLWIGGANDLGFRAADGAGGGTFLLSNWLVLVVSLVLIASRLPLTGLPSRILWHREARGRRTGGYVQRWAETDASGGSESSVSYSRRIERDETVSSIRLSGPGAPSAGSLTGHSMPFRALRCLLDIPSSQLQRKKSSKPASASASIFLLRPLRSLLFSQM